MDPQFYENYKFTVLNGMEKSAGGKSRLLSNIWRVLSGKSIKHIGRDVVGALKGNLITAPYYLAKATGRLAVPATLGGSALWGLGRLTEAGARKSEEMGKALADSMETAGKSTWDFIYGLRPGNIKRKIHEWTADDPAPAPKAPTPIPQIPGFNPLEQYAPSPFAPNGNGINIGLY